jgi:hypothetical protein
MRRVIKSIRVGVREGEQLSTDSPDPSWVGRLGGAVIYRPDGQDYVGACCSFGRESNRDEIVVRSGKPNRCNDGSSSGVPTCKQ